MSRIRPSRVASVLACLASLATAQEQSTHAPVGIVPAKSGHGKNTPQGDSIKPDGSNLFEVLAKSWNEVPMFGTRVYTLFVDAKRIYHYHESVLVAGSDGKFSLKLNKIERHDGFLTHDLTLRKKAFELRSGFLYHHRDFRVHDAKVARKNYTVTPMGSVFRNGRILAVFDINPRPEIKRSASCSSYRVLVDRNFPVVLDQLEFAPNGSVISSVFYSSVVLGREIQSPHGWWKPWMKVTEHASIRDATKAGELGFTPRPPRALGDGFVLRAVRTTFHPSRQKLYLVLGYTDGIDSRFVLQGKSTALAIAPTLPGKKASTERPLVPVKRYSMGPVTQYHIEYDGIEYLIIGTFFDRGVPPLVGELMR